jgi:ATP-binding protein involved in chromosome partitioning
VPAKASVAQATIMVGSGKGGVGKSTVALNLAFALNRRAPGRVGLLDADLHGPNIPRMLGITHDTWTHAWTMARPGPPTLIRPTVAHGLKVVSAGTFLGEDQAMGMDGLTLRMFIRHLALDVEWGDLDFLVIDLPPGTGDAERALAEALVIAGAVIVVTPQELAHLDARKAIAMFRRLKVPIIGALENMSWIACPSCGERVALFPPVSIARSIWNDVKCLASLPLIPALASVRSDAATDLEIDATFDDLAERLSAAL